MAGHRNYTTTLVPITPASIDKIADTDILRKLPGVTIYMYTHVFRNLPNLFKKYNINID